jgi:hypothetical protein
VSALLQKRGLCRLINILAIENRFTLPLGRRGDEHEWYGDAGFEFIADRESEKDLSESPVSADFLFEVIRT